nr:MAG TPA: hypothetical protein [Caudoviricetes sp.]
MRGPRKAVRLFGERTSNEVSELFAPLRGNERYGVCEDEAAGLLPTATAVLRW